MITQATADRAIERLTAVSQFNWEDDPAHPDFGAARNVKRRELLAIGAYARDPFRLSYVYMSIKLPNPLYFSTAVSEEIWSRNALLDGVDCQSAINSIKSLILELVGADSIETDGAYFSDESDETVAAILRKVGAPKGKVQVGWNLCYSDVKTERWNEESEPSKASTSTEKPAEKAAASLYKFWAGVGLIILGLIGVLAMAGAS